MKNKINILLIDDNPTYALCSKELIPNIPGAVLTNKRIQEIPWVSTEIYSGDDELEQKLDNVENLFHLQWCQFHNDAYEFRKLSSIILNRYGKQELFKNGFVPDIIIFDYALTDFNPDLPSETLSHLEDEELNRFINPNVKLSNFLQQKTNADFKLPQDKGYLDTSTIGNPEIKNVDLIQDSYGLYCGTLITELFRYDFPLSALPVTKKDEGVVKAEPEAAFLEWFVNNSYYNVFKRMGRTVKDWHSILKDALKIYRADFLEKLKNSIITVDLNNIFDIISSFSVPKLKDKSVVSLVFHSDYGKHELPLDGLFIDCEIDIDIKISEKAASILGEIKMTKRKESIAEFIYDILRIISYDLPSNEIRSVIEKVDKLFKIFDSALFTQRIIFSELHSKLNQENKLNSEEQKAYRNCLDKFEIKDNTITNYSEISISQLGSKGRNKNVVLNKMIVAFSAIHLWKRYDDFINYLKKKDTEYDGFDQPTEALLPPDLDDLLLLLFPLWTTNIVLFNKEGHLGGDAQKAIRSSFKTMCGCEPTLLKSIDYGICLNSFLTKEEFHLAQSYARGLNFQQFPDHLKSYGG